MSEFYDQDLEPEQEGNLKHWVFWIALILIVAGAWGYLSGFYGDLNQGSEVAADRDVSSYRSQAAEWTACDESMFVPADWFSDGFDSGAVECATFTVPASYSNEYGSELPDLTISVLKSPALDQEGKLGTLFFNPGGPGESGINLVQYLAIPEEIRQKYDVVGFDPRGVGKSSPIRCDDTDTIDYYFETVSSPEDEAEGIANSEWQKESVADCAELNPDWWVMTSLNTVQDMDIMREVVAGEDKLNFVGMSYGTTLAVEYIRAFPEHAGRIVLDSVTSNDDEDYNQAELESTYKALTALFDKCAEDVECPGSTNAEVQEVIFKAKALADKGELMGSAKNLSSLDVDSDFVSSDDELLYYGLLALTYGSTEASYPDFRDSMVKLAAGDAWYFEFEALELYGWNPVGEGEWERSNSSDLLNIVNCLDVDSRDQRSKEKIAEDEKRFAAADPFTSKFFAADSGYVYVGERAGCQWSWLAFDDPKIPDPPDLMKSPVNESGETFLVIGSKLDTVTPIENALDTAKLLRSRMLTYEGSGHVPSFGGIECIDTAVVEYLVRGYLPAEDIVCAEK
jgi:pimeloyl-ACP methyl ester carboxylesterase